MRVGIARGALLMGLVAAPAASLAGCDMPAGMADSSTDAPADVVTVGDAYGISPDVVSMGEMYGIPPEDAGDVVSMGDAYGIPGDATDVVTTADAYGLPPDTGR